MGSFFGCPGDALVALLDAETFAAAIGPKAPGPRATSRGHEPRVEENFESTGGASCLEWGGEQMFWLVGWFSLVWFGLAWLGLVWLGWVRLLGLVCFCLIDCFCFFWFQCLVFGEGE